MRVNDTWKTATVNTKTPDGSLYLIVMEDITGKPQRVNIQIGKSGTRVRAWSAALEDMINLLLAHNVDLVTIVAHIIGNASDHVMHNEEGKVRSGPDGVAYAVLVYLRDKKAAESGQPYFAWRR